MKSSLNTKIMELVYQLEGAGWADARISDGSRQLGMSVSYLSDALGDMAKAALHLLRGGREASFSFEDEPGQREDRPEQKGQQFAQAHSASWLRD